MGTRNLEILVDYRENKLIELLNTANLSRLDKVSITTTNLQVGDIVINYNRKLASGINKYYKMIIERKTIPDLISSIKDGRYKEQKIRILSCKNNDNKTGTLCDFLYLIEGNITNTKYKTAKDNKGVYGSWISMVFRDNIKMIRTWDTTESAIFIMRLADRIMKDAKDIWAHTTNTTNADTNTTNADTNTTDTNIKQIKLHLDTKNTTTTDKNIIIIKGDKDITPNNKDIAPDNKDIAPDNKDIAPDNKDIAPDNKDISPDNKDIKPITIISHKNISHKNRSSESVKSDLEIEYLSSFTVKTKKGDNLTPDTCQKIMLSIIPGMSCNISIQVLQHFGSLSLLIDWLKLDFIKALIALPNNTNILKKLKKHDLATYRYYKDTILQLHNLNNTITNAEHIYTYNEFITDLEAINRIGDVQGDVLSRDKINIHLDVLKKYFIIAKKQELAELKIVVNTKNKNDCKADGTNDIDKERKLGPSLAEKIYTYLTN